MDTITLDEEENIIAYINSRFGLSSEMWQYFHNQHIVITGAGTGYGRALTVALLAAGANVYLLGRRGDKLLETVREAQRLEVHRGRSQCISCDITDLDQIQSAVRQIRRDSETIDTLIHCAALSAAGNATLLDSSPSRWNEMFDTNLKAQWMVSKAILGCMQDAAVARVLFFTSGAGWADTVGFGLYNISKAALNALSMSLANEYQNRFPDKTVSINCINPAEARSQMNTGSTISAYSICKMALTVLSTRKNIPNGRFFHRDGRYLKFCNANEFEFKLE